jgi:DNA-directed RNA polymerase specialized sigma24 family protein
LFTSGWSTLEIIERCSSRPADELAWQEFVRRFHVTIEGSVTKACQQKGRDKALRNLLIFENTIDDLVQVVYFRLIDRRSHLLKQMDLTEPGIIYDYLTIISYRVVLDHFRGSNRVFSRENA